MLYALFLLLNVVLFLRPAELVPGMRGLPLYQVTILACLVAAFAELIYLVDSRRIKKNPVNACVLLLLVAIPFSHFAQATTVSIYYGRMAFVDFGKVVLYYFVAFAVLMKEARFESFLRWLMIMIACVAALSLGHEYGLFTIPELASLERNEMIESVGQIQLSQLRGTGIFNDPNDLAMILTVGVVLSAHVMMSKSAGFARMVALPGLLVCLLGIYETKSRGGMLALLSAGCVLSYARWGIYRATAVSSVGVAMAAVVFAVRGGGGSESGTAQSRIQLWSEGLTWLKWRPLFGIGYDRYAKEMSQVAHNSFVHCFTELGLFGGALFLGTFVAALLAIWRLYKLDSLDLPRKNRQRLVTVAACLVGAAVAMLSLSRSYVVPTYLILAMGAAAVAIESRRLAKEEVPINLPRFNQAFLKQLTVSSFGFLLATYLFVRVFARWG